MLIFFSDPHLGVNRRVNTTPASRARMYQRVLHTPLTALLENTVEDKDTVVCAGDMFDKFTNKEDIILDASQLFVMVDLCLAGNHDSVNNTEIRGSLDLLEGMHPYTVCFASTGAGNFVINHNESTNTDLIMVPHHSRQDLMEETLHKALDSLTTDSASTKVLVAHCNYNLPEAFTNDVTLNLTEEDVQYLLDNGIDYVLLGHDHTPREYFDGRLRILGNTQPTSFSDISDKYIHTFDGETFTKIKIWDAATKYKELDVSLDWPALPEDVEFLKIVGKTMPDDVIKVVHRIKDLWDEYPNLLCVSDSTEVQNVNDLVTKDTAVLSSTSVFDTIDAHLKPTDLYPLWRKISKGVVQC